MTARWVVDEVKDQRDLQITWQPFSLLLKNQPAEGTPYYDGVLRTYKMLRVMESVRATEGNEGVFALYWELGARIHHDKDREFDIADALEAAGLPAMHAEAFESPLHHSCQLVARRTPKAEAFLWRWLQACLRREMLEAFAFVSVSVRREHGCAGRARVDPVGRVQVG